jgi:hypothetical protein
MGHRPTQPVSMKKKANASNHQRGGDSMKYSHPAMMPTKIRIA